jgi:hypothetical protein
LFGGIETKAYPFALAYGMAISFKCYLPVLLLLKLPRPNWSVSNPKRASSSIVMIVRGLGCYS